MTELRKASDGAVVCKRGSAWRTVITPVGSVLGSESVELIEEAIALWRKPVLPDGWESNGTNYAHKNAFLAVDANGDRLRFSDYWYKAAEVREALQVLDILTKGKSK